MKIHARRFLVLIPVMVMAACDGNDPVCTGEARAGIAVTVQTDGGGTPENGTLDAVARDGSFEDVQPVVDGHAHLAFERGGTYLVQIVDSENGVVLWTDSDVDVTEDECHVTTVELSAVVEPS